MYINIQLSILYRTFVFIKLLTNDKREQLMMEKEVVFVESILLFKFIFTQHTTIFLKTNKRILKMLTNVLF